MSMRPSVSEPLGGGAAAAEPERIVLDFGDFAAFGELFARRVRDRRVVSPCTADLEVGQIVVLELRAGGPNPVGRAVARTLARSEDRQDVEWELLWFDPAAHASIEALRRMSKLPARRPARSHLVEDRTSAKSELSDLAAEIEEALANLDPREKKKAKPTLPRVPAQPPVTPPPEEPPRAFGTLEPEKANEIVTPPRTEEGGIAGEPRFEERVPEHLESIPSPDESDAGPPFLLVLAAVAVVALAGFWFLGSGGSDSAPSASTVEASTEALRPSDATEVSPIPEPAAASPAGTDGDDHASSSLRPEDARPAGLEAREESTEAAAEAPVEQETTRPDPISTIEERLGLWSEAWQAGDVTKYLSFYSPRFMPQRGSREAWTSTRESRLTGPEWIRVELTEIEIEVDRDSAESRFVQSYSRPGYSDVVSKTVSWVREDEGIWRIREEVAR